MFTQQLISRQQLHIDDDPDLVSHLGFETEEIKKLESSLTEIEKDKSFNSETEDILHGILNDLRTHKKTVADYKPTTQQLVTTHSKKYDEKQHLIKQLNNKKVKKFDVFVTELCDGNLGKTNKKFTLTQSIDICKQLLEGLQQLEKSEKCHNDLKPDNILYKTTKEKYQNGDSRVVIKIADFGTADRSGGTPGWTWPGFLTKRELGRSDMYSTALLILYMMCDSRHLFYRLRDNYIQGFQDWLTEFRKDPLVEFVRSMMTLKLTIQQCIDNWEELSNHVDFLMEIDLIEDYHIPLCWLKIQDKLDEAFYKVADASNLDK